MGECKRRRKRNECCEPRWRSREERTLQMVSGVEKPGEGQGGNDNDKLFQQTNAIRGWPPSWLLRGQTILTPPTARKQHLAFFPIPTSPAFSADFTRSPQNRQICDCSDSTEPLIFVFLQLFLAKQLPYSGRTSCQNSSHIIQCVLHGWNLLSIHKHSWCNTLRSPIQHVQSIVDERRSSLRSVSKSA